MTNILYFHGVVRDDSSSVDTNSEIFTERDDQAGSDADLVGKNLSKLVSISTFAKNCLKFGRSFDRGSSSSGVNGSQKLAAKLVLVKGMLKFFPQVLKVEMIKLFLPHVRKVRIETLLSLISEGYFTISFTANADEVLSDRSEVWKFRSVVGAHRSSEEMEHRSDEMEHRSGGLGLRSIDLEFGSSSTQTCNDGLSLMPFGSIPLSISEPSVFSSILSVSLGSPSPLSRSGQLALYGGRHQVKTLRILGAESSSKFFLMPRFMIAKKIAVVRLLSRSVIKDDCGCQAHDHGRLLSTALCQFYANNTPLHALPEAIQRLISSITLLLDFTSNCGSIKISTANTLPWEIRIKVAIGVARVLSFLHNLDNQVLTWGIRTSSILLDVEFNPKLSGFKLARAGPSGDATHVSTRVMGTSGYAAPEYIATGRLTAKNDVYCFGVVLLELLSGRRARDMNRSSVEQNLVKWAFYLSDKRKLFRIMDTRLEGQYPQRGAYMAAALALQCLGEDAKARPTMAEALTVLEEIPNASKTSSQSQ
ncbi:hypothetical protein Sjap_023856 [Stephania japonica]|uniref:Protein kinase domain-containing protein n=1 Tax=Stephania japonica TaxID=461633 RepID=A0AAP0ECG8_9MAGN